MKTLDFYLKWIGTAVALLGAAFTSLNYYPAGPIMLNLGAAIWLWVGIIWKEWSLIVINGALLVIYTVGLISKFWI